MTLLENIKLINGGGIFQAYAEDAILLNGRVIKNEQDVGLTEHQYNYFYTRHDDRPIRIQSAERPMSSNTPYEIASPKVLVLQFKEYDLNGIMYAVLNAFNGNYNRLRYEVNQVEIRKEIILKSEIGEVRPMDGYRLIKISYTEFLPLDNCEEITCNGDVVIPLTNDVKVYINDVLRYEPSCNTNLELTLVDHLGNPIDATYNGTEIVVDTSCEDVRVSNSDDSYDVNVVSGGDLELPDITVSNSDDSYSVTYPSVQDVELPDETINIVDEDGNPLDSITFPVYTDPNIDISSYCPPPVGATLMKTGQTTSYRTGDDGDIEAGRATDFFTLSTNNPFGSTSRFTDELGGSTYTNNIVIDWSTYDTVAGTVLGIVKNFVTLGTATWNNAIDNSLAYTAGTFTSGWRLINRTEINNLCNLENSNYPINYPPFNALFGGNIWTSSTFKVLTTYAWYLNNTSADIRYQAKTNAYYYIPVRTFTVSGTTLT